LAYDLGTDKLRERGFCPLIEPTARPRDGIFIVEAHFRRFPDQRAAPFTSSQLVSTPPGRTITFVSVEDQRRTGGQVELLAWRRKYEAPGLLGLPPLIGCWDRPDSIVWIMPAGDAGCGLWRWVTSGGDQNWSGDTSWVYADVFR
jgi:hypothetical protein